MLGSSSIAGLIEKLALKWIQEGMASDATQVNLHGVVYSSIIVFL